LRPEEQNYVRENLAKEVGQTVINQYERMVIIIAVKNHKTDWQTAEGIRKAGAEVAASLNKQKIKMATITNLSEVSAAGLRLAEGAALANYQFVKYKKDAEKLAYSLEQLKISSDSADAESVEALNIAIAAIYKTRDLVNEPLNYLSAVQLSEAIAAMGTEAGFNVEVKDKDFIVAEKMGGILAVNRGSKQPPTFTIMEYRPEHTVNPAPIVLVGKGIVYDTGGLSLKPTPASMDRMKSDMSGAALVSGAMYAIARMKLPLHVIALVPATDNRPGEEAYTPGDIITMYSGTTVEVLNTDAEGRLVLGDALHWAKRYEPLLVLDFATLTGAASVAVGEHGIVCMGTAEEAVKERIKSAGFAAYERLVEYPLWDEYGEQIKTDFADLKNVGGASGGAITAGKFLEHFTDYPWMHFDIAGVSFSLAKKGYQPNGGTGYGLRMLLEFLKCEVAAHSA
jgi:leucyl aminopeptidase